jgi:hypothetical protein
LQKQGKDGTFDYSDVIREDADKLQAKIINEEADEIVNERMKDIEK